MKEIKIKTGKGEWLNQKKLQDAITEIYRESIVIRELKVPDPTPKRPGNAKRIDISYEHKGKKYAVEYDGPMHYVNTRRCLRDIKRLEWLCLQKYNVIRFPYYLELDNGSFSYLFNEKINIINEHSKPLVHGFNDTEWLPMDFCPLGIRRFISEFELYPSDIRKSIVDSLVDEAKTLKVSLETIVPIKILNVMNK